MIYEELRNKFIAGSKELVKQKESGREDQVREVEMAFKSDCWDQSTSGILAT